MVKIVHKNPEIILKKNPKIFLILSLWRHLDPPKRALFEHFEQIFADFGFLPNYNMEITPINTMMEMVYSTQEIILKKIQNLHNALTQMSPNSKK